MFLGLGFRPRGWSDGPYVDAGMCSVGTRRVGKRTQFRGRQRFDTVIERIP